jgi:hypothetical protein
MSLWHVVRGTSPCFLEPRSTTSHRQNRGTTIDASPPDQDTRSRASTSPRSPASSWKTMNASDPSRNRSRQIWRAARKQAAHMKNRQANGGINSEMPPWRSPLVWECSWGILILPGRHSHHPNDKPQQINHNPNYGAEERGPPSLLPPERQGRRGNQHLGWWRWEEDGPPPPRRLWADAVSILVSLVLKWMV